MPAREFPIGGEAIHRFQMAWYDSFEGDADLCPAFTEISAGRVPGGAEYYLPLFFERCGTVFDYLPAWGRPHAAGRPSQRGTALLA